MILFITTSACSQSTNDTDEATPIQPKLGNSFQGPIQNRHQDMVQMETMKWLKLILIIHNMQEHRFLIFYPKGITSPRPTIFFSHPFGGEDKDYNIELYNFIAKKGYVVVFVPYRTVDISVDHRYQTLWEGFVKAATDYPNIIDTQKVGFMGHSFRRWGNY
jgi:predicted dienelactone hydrolase